MPKDDNDYGNHTLLIVNAINNQTEVLERLLNNRLNDIEKIVIENKKNIESINCNRCVDAKLDYNGFTIRMKTLLTIIIIMEIIQLYEYFNNPDIKSLILNLI